MINTRFSEGSVKEMVGKIKKGINLIPFFIYLIIISS
ncbi:hypothetical protein CHRY9390_01094 [Chryseobacterium aquaeductus]|uniref:Uncharacterized protein n=1 Tax=Chryseobacterium aquaeductus TaxID=2675056 RepID=A0A9N8MGT9_9FLAO|nr:hypothetical protein CHRY9390_01094 [Chryseobacterium potabilaquae]CAD7803553.1 hypothetical protein CHRY9390_01094 [Chryseobacterium aquaeductus]